MTLDVHNLAAFQNAVAVDHRCLALILQGGDLLDEGLTYRRVILPFSYEKFLSVCTNRKSTFFTFLSGISALDPPALFCETAQPVRPLDVTMPASTPDGMMITFVFVALKLVSELAL